MMRAHTAGHDVTRHIIYWNTVFCQFMKINNHGILIYMFLFIVFVCLIFTKTLIHVLIQMLFVYL